MLMIRPLPLPARAPSFPHATPFLPPRQVKAGNAVEALKSKLASKANVLRDGQWHELPASELVQAPLGA